MTEFQWPENCLDCGYYHEASEDWAAFCDLFHGNGIDPNCDQKKPIISDTLRIEMAERKCENCNDYTENGVCKLDGGGKSPLEDCNEFSINKHRKQST